MDHNRTVLLAVCAGVLKLEALGQLHIQLDGAALPGTTDGIRQMEVQLGAVECAVALVDNVVLANLGDGLCKGLFRKLPVLQFAHVILRHGGQLDLIGQTEGGVNLIEQTNDVLDLVLHLIPGHEDVGIILREAAHAEQAVQRTGQLVTVYQTQLADTQRQLLVGVRLSLVNQHAARAVHRLDCVILVVDDGGVHVLLVVIPVTGTLPQLAVEDHRGGNLNVAVALVYLAPVVDQGVLEGHAVRQEERKARAFLGQHEQAELLAQLAVIALLRLFQHVEVLVEFVLLRECGAVNTLQHLLGGIAAPVSAGNVHQLDAVALYAAGGVQMRTCAQVSELALLVEGNGSVFRQIVNQLYLVRLLALFHELDGLCARQLEALELLLLLADLAHLCLESIEVLLREGERRIKIVVEAVVDGGADGQLDLRIQAFYCLRENMRYRVTVGVAVFLVLKRVLVFFGHFYSDLSCKIITSGVIDNGEWKMKVSVHGTEFYNVLCA